MKPLVCLCLAVLALSLPAAARGQLESGNLYGTVVDNQGSPLPGVTVTLAGQGAPHVQVTDAQGRFRFLGEAPGEASLRTELEGFSTVDYPNIQVRKGRNTTIEVTMSPTVEDVITVTSESPILDERRIATGSTVSQAELEKIPTARDPWTILQQTPGVLADRINVGGNEPPADGAGADIDPMEAFARVMAGQDLPGVQAGYGPPPDDLPAGDQPAWIATPRDPWAFLQTAPGVLTDRINLGGNESGQQSSFAGPGSEGGSAWAVDGVVITDMAAIGASPSYYDFDSFEEMQFSTGGSDATIATGGVVLNMVTKRGTNEWRGSGRYFISDDDWQSGQNAVRNAPGGALEFGGEVGGPIVKDRLWIWGSYGSQEVDLLPQGGAVRETPAPSGSEPRYTGILSSSAFLEMMYRRGYTRGCDVPGMSVFTTSGGDCGQIRTQLQNVYGTGAFQGLFPDPFAEPTTYLGGTAPPGGRVGSVTVDPSDPSGNTVYSSGTTGGVWKTTNFLTTDPDGPKWVPLETTWGQNRMGQDLDGQRLEDTHIFSSNFYLTGLYSVVDGGFQLVPQSGRAGGVVEIDHQEMQTQPGTLYTGWLSGWDTGFQETGVGTLLGTPRSLYVLDRNDFTACPGGGVFLQGRFGDRVDLGNGSSFEPFEPVNDRYKLDCSNFFNTGNPSHELKFGAGYRDAANELEIFPPGGTWFVGGGALTEDEREDALSDELVRSIEHAVRPEFVVGAPASADPPAEDSVYLQDRVRLGDYFSLNLGVRYDENEAPPTETADPRIFNPSFFNGFPTAPLSQKFGGRFRFTWDRGSGAAPDQRGPGGSGPTDGAAAADAAAPTVLLVSLGQSTGDAFRAVVLGDSPATVDGVAVIEPVSVPAAQLAELQRTMEAAGAVTATVEAYCFEFDGVVPAAGAAYRFAPPDVQQAFEPLARVLRAAERVREAGGLTPDTALDTYAPAISQWAIWSREKGFDLESFGAAWLDHVKKNVAQAGEDFTAELEQAVRDRVPGRWRDIEKILAEAGS